MSLLAGINNLDDVDLDNQRIFVRADLDAPAKAGVVTDDSRIVASLPTLKKLLERGARVIVGSRFGEARSQQGSLGKEDAPSIEPAAHRLAELLGAEVLLPDSCSGDAVKKVVTSLRENQLCVLENLAREDDVGAGAEAFARELLNFADFYIGDTLRALSLDSATTTILPKLLERRYVGLHLDQELKSLARLRSAVDRPRLLIWGGSSLSERLPLLNRLAQHSERVYFTGVPANTLIRARGGVTGKSTVEESYLAGARTLLDQLGPKALLPTDFLTGESPKSDDPRVNPADSVAPERMALDLGPESLRSLIAQIGRAESVLFCGTAGFSRNPAFATGTRKILETMAESSGFTVVAGEDSVAAALAVGPELTERIKCFSLGGAAAFSLLSDNKLAGLEALRGTTTDDNADQTDRR